MKRPSNAQALVWEPEPSALDLIEQLADVGTSEETEGVSPDYEMDEIIRLCRAYGRER